MELNSLTHHAVMYEMRVVIEESIHGVRIVVDHLTVIYPDLAVVYDVNDTKVYDESTIIGNPVVFNARKIEIIEDADENGYIYFIVRIYVNEP